MVYKGDLKRQVRGVFALMSTSPKLLIFLLFNILMRIGAYNLDHYGGKETTNLRRLVNLEKTQSEDAMEIIRSKPALLKRIVKSCSCGNRHGCHCQEDDRNQNAESDNAGKLFARLRRLKPLSIQVAMSRKWKKSQAGRYPGHQTGRPGRQAGRYAMCKYYRNYLR